MSSTDDALEARTRCSVVSIRSVARASRTPRSEEHTSELQSPCNLVCRLLLEKKNSYQARIRLDNRQDTLRLATPPAVSNALHTAFTPLSLRRIQRDAGRRVIHSVLDLRRIVS